LIKDYSGPGTGTLTADPQFVDPANADFHLKAASPCINAGTSTTAVKADFSGVQRGIKSAQTPPGYVKKYDIGAYEFVPTPVGVYIQNGAPDAIRGGDALNIAWQMDSATAGTAIQLQLFNDQHLVQSFGLFDTGSTSGTATLTLDHSLPGGGAYYFRGVSAFNAALTAATPVMNIIGVNGVRPEFWNRLR